MNPIKHGLRTLIIYCLVCTPIFLVAQNEQGRPFITNYAPKEYGYSGINWWIEQDDRGFLYFANNSGVLELDGVNWRLIEVIEDSEVRSLAKNGNGVIHVGTNGDLGYLSPDEKGLMQFKSLKPKLPEEYRQFEEVWETFYHQGEIYFRTNNQMMIWNDERFRIITSEEGFHVGKVAHNKIYQRIWGIGLTVFNGEGFDLVPGGEKFANDRIYEILEYDEKRLLIGTRDLGLFIYDGQKFEPLPTTAQAILDKRSLYLPGLVLDNDRFLINTFNDGLFIINKEGEMLQYFNDEVGLRDNTVSYVFMDKDDNLWLALFNGIAKIELGSPFTYYDTQSGLESNTNFVTQRYEGVIYTGGQNGISYLDPLTNRFKKVEGTTGQTPDLIIKGGDLLATSGDLGVYQVKGKSVVPIRESINYDYRASFFYVSKVDTTLVYVILMDGLSALRLNPQVDGPQRWQEESSRDDIFTSFFGFEEMSDGRIMTQGDNPGEIKMITPKYVNGKLDLPGSELEVFTTEDGLPNAELGLATYKGQIYVSGNTSSDFYIFDEAKKRFKKVDAEFAKYANNNNVSALPVLDAKGRTWANWGEGIYIEVPQSETNTIIDKPFLRLKDFPTWQIFPESDQDGNDIVWFTGPNGIVRMDGNIEEFKENHFKASIREVHQNQDSLIYAGAGNIPEKLIFDHHENTVSFTFGAPDFSIKNGLEFQTFLQGLNKDWSEWTSQSQREYLNLAPGDYTFRVRARNVYQTTGDEAVFHFTIQPPWYKTWWAYLLYGLGLVGLIGIIVKWRTSQLQAQSEKLDQLVKERTLEVQQQAEELSTVNKVSQAMVEQLKLDELIPLVGDQMRNLFKADIVYLAMIDPKTKIINFPYQYGDNMPPLKLGEGLTSKIILTRKPFLINEDVSGRYEKMGIEEVGKKAASYLGVPIPVGDEVIGVLSVQSTQNTNRFNKNDQRLLSTIAANVGIAIHNAELFEQAEVARNEAETANEAKSAFLSTVSHELRTPLTSVLGFAKIIKKRLENRIFPIIQTEDPKVNRAIKQVSENLNVVVSEGERLTGLINDVLDLAKIEAGKIEWHISSMSIGEVVNRAIASTKSLFDEKSITLKNDTDALLPVIKGDQNKLIQVVINLLSNAVKFTNDGTVSIRAIHEDDQIIVSVTDTGIGISEKDLPHVFEKFKQVGDTLTDKPQGTGLGLPICKEIVEHHGGKMWVESTLNSGSTFFFSLPVNEDNDSIQPVELEDLVNQLKMQFVTQPVKSNGADPKILVVDDDLPIRSLLSQELGEAGYQVLEAVNGKEALDKVRSERPDLIILDVMMPEINGFDVAAVLKNDPQTMDIPIIILSIVQDESRGYRIGVDRYLTKPIDTEKLFNEVGSLLKQGKSSKKVLVVDENSHTIQTLAQVLQEKGYHVAESNGAEIVEKAKSLKPDIIMFNALHLDKQEIVKTLRFEKGLENVLFLVYQ